MSSSPKVTGRKIADVARVTYSIPEFCAAHGISQPFYFKLRAQGVGPREVRVGKRVLISLESAAEWRRQRETGSLRNEQGPGGLPGPCYFEPRSNRQEGRGD